MISIFNALIEKRFFKTIGKKLKKIWESFFNALDKLLSYITLFFYSKTVPVIPRRVLFLTFRGAFDCNPKWICKELASRDADLELWWSFKPSTITGLEDFPSNVHLVKYGTAKFFNILCSAEMIIDNGISMSFLEYRKKKGQILIETWHGSLGIKRFTAADVKDKRWVRRITYEGKVTDHVISNSDYEDFIYCENYWKPKQILKLGHARNDVLFSDDSSLIKLKEKICSVYGISPDAHICLYAPTFRDDGDMTPYNIDYESLRSALRDRFGGSWIIMTRFHYRLFKKLSNIKLPYFVIDASKYPDIQELAACTDVAITDYSSWICEYVLTRRPGFIFASDVDTYEKNDRRFYFPLTDLPFPFSKTSNVLINNILVFDEKKYAEDCEKFLGDKGVVDDGHASERISDALLKIINKESV